MWLIAGVFTLVAILAGLWETYAIAKHKLTITEWTRTHPHAAIIVFSTVFAAFGYALGQGGQ